MTPNPIDQSKPVTIDENVRNILAFKIHDTAYDALTGQDKLSIDQSVSAIHSLIIKELNNLSMEVVESCEPDCDDVRHAKHEGTWQAHLVIEKRIEDLTAHQYGLGK
jgi:hypothetical protein